MVGFVFVPNATLTKLIPVKMLNPPQGPKSGDGDVASAEGALVLERQ